MPKKSKGKHRLDKFYHLAKEQGFRSRAAFKLIQLNRQFRFLGKARTCLDLCAAPGGWMQVAVKEMPLNSFILGIDLDPIKPIRGCRSIVGDITTTKARAAIKKESGGQKIEVVLHDGAPNVGGVWASEAYTQSALVLEALRLATDVLTPKGTFVTKIFRSQDYNALLFAFKQLFTKVEATKPAASRNTSAEIFVVCLGYKAPAKIDPRLLDPKHLFKEVEEAPRMMGPDALLKQKVKQRRFREGYAEGMSSLFKQTTAAAFIASENPVEMLGQYTRFSLEDPDDEEGEPGEGAGEEEKPSGSQSLTQTAAFARAHPATNTEIRTLLDDLQVLGRSEFKQLLKWRLKLKKELDAAKKATSAGAEKAAEEEVESEQDEEEKLLQEMQEVKAQAEQRQKRDKKKRIEGKKKARIRAAQLAMGEGIADETGPNPLFSLASIKGNVRAGDLGADAEVPDEDAAESSEEEDNAETEDVTDYDTDDERRMYEAEQEEAMEEAYQSYLERKGHRAEVAEQKRARLEKPGNVLGNLSAEPVTKAMPKDHVTFPEQPELGGGLLVESGPQQKSPAELARDWYSQDIFKNYAGLLDPEDIAPSKRQKVAPQDLSDSDSDEADEPAEDDGPGIADDDDASDQLLETKRTSLSSGKGQSGVKDGGFEVVPQDASDSDASSASDIEEPGFQESAEIRAVAKAMLKGRRKNDIIEDGYHRYAFHDTHLPRWFQEDEEKHMRPPAVVSKEEVEAEKERMRAIDARPVKKIAEARARKKKRLQVRLEQAKSKANNIIEQGDLSERAKAKEVAALYAKAKAGAKKKKKPTRNDKFKKKGPPLDRRLYSDKRQVDNKKKKAAAKARKKGGAKNKGRK